MLNSRRPPLVFFVAVISILMLSACSAGGEGTDTTAAAPPEPPAQTALENGAADPGPSSDAPAEAPASPTTMATEPKYEPSQATGAVVGVPAETNTAPIVAVANYYTDLPGFDLNVLEERQREQFLHRVNSEMCSCGCKNDTLARCLVNDQTCPLVRGMVQRIYDEVRSGS